MTTVKLYGEHASPATQCVMTVCNELGITCDFIFVDFMNGEHKTPEYINTRNPFGAIPVLVDNDGTQIFESRAISRYLTAKYGKNSGLLPNPGELEAYGRFEQAASIEHSSFDPHAAELAFQRNFAGMIGLEPDEKVVQKCIDTMNSKMEGYERILSKQKYLAGDNFTLADLFHIPYGKHINDIDPTIFGTKPSVKRWWEDISSRPSWKALN
ncbi:unnamed protein product [Rhizoctonia solani]|uniref:glutathione transferase n=1 Tax=Rhizoctonia solani TaxID=456999 RepID=A0A8H3GQ50_9AGAM|nr:unnamed protein product [Rhizoctonia solani]